MEQSTRTKEGSREGLMLTRRGDASLLQRLMVVKMERVTDCDGSSPE